MKDIENQGGPKLMYGVKWSCELEKKASQLLQPGEKTSQSPEAGETTFPIHVVLNFTSTQGSSRAAKIKDVFDKMKADSNGRSTLSSPNVPFFGCAYSNENRSLRVLCVFLRDSNDDTSEHSSCSVDSDCSKYEGSTCSDKLCWAPTQEAVQ
ncbi:hypothetical protein Q1695_004225 [Nippostrongylus brasiliensis]|nr:hypothetical protein Q1695_004225 [Nippostrongylus brasiliensis]